MERSLTAIDSIFNPVSVAVIGASDNPDKLGSHVMKSLIQGRYPGRIYPVNPGKDEIMGIKTYPSLTRVPDIIDLSIVVLPAEQVPKIIKECQEKGVKGIVLITAGFKEIEDKRGEILQREIMELANQYGIKIIGPNTFGIANLHLPLNASFTPEFSLVEKGGISFVSQSGGMSHLMAFLSLPNKVGRSSTSDKASQFHTGSLAGKHEIYESAFKQAGILTVGSSEELLDTAKALTMCPLPQGNRVAVLSGQAGPGMGACDVCEMEGLIIPPFSAETQKRVEELLPPLAIRTNPVDMGPAWYNSEAAKGIVKTVLEDKKIDAVILCIMFASANRSAVGVLTHLLLERRTNKPVLCCFSYPAGIWDDEIKQLEGSGIPNYPTPERAAKVLSNLYRFSKIRE